MNAPPPAFNIIESTLREGEQFANTFFDTETKIRIAKALDAFGVEYIELTSPVASEQFRADCEAICKLGLRAKILTHIRCNMDDACVAVQTAYITQSALEVITFVKSKNIEIRFSSEDSFRSDLVDLLSIYQAVERIGVHRVGIADTVGYANPRQVYELVRTLRGVVRCDIEVHLHKAIANAYTALEAGATHIDTSVLGIGERNGITPLGGLIACLYAAHPDVVKGKYNLPPLRELEDLVACAWSGASAFTHKAGVYDKFQGVVADPAAQVFSPTDFGLVWPKPEVVPIVGAAA